MAKLLSRGLGQNLRFGRLPQSWLVALVKVGSITRDGRGPGRVEGEAGGSLGDAFKGCRDFMKIQATCQSLDAELDNGVYFLCRVGWTKEVVGRVGWEHKLSQRFEKSGRFISTSSVQSRVHLMT